MKKTVISGLMFAALLAPVASAQNGPMDRCQDERACDTASDQIITEAKKTLTTGRHREAARQLYPVVLSRKTSALAKRRASNALSEVLEKAGLYEYAAVQKRNATETTRAPSSAELLAHARLVAKSNKKDRTLSAYSDVEALAVASANLTTVDALIGDYNRIGERARANALQSKRGELRTRAEAACAAVNCQGQRIVSAKVESLGPVEFPREAGRRQVGDCKVTLNVTEAGRPVDLTPSCNDPVFVEAAMIAVQESRFTPRYENGVPRPQYNIVMPFEFQPR